MNTPEFSTLTVTLVEHVAEVRLNRPDKSNAMNEAMWQEIRQAFEWVDATPEARVAILSGEGKNFCAGIDLAMLASIQQQIAHVDGARSREALRRQILDLQDCLSSIERCRKPVIAAIQGACVGGALDLVSCCDMRYAAGDAVFSIKEIDLGMVADVGTLQRLPRLIGEGMTRELAYTGRTVGGAADERRFGAARRSRRRRGGTARPDQLQFWRFFPVDRRSPGNRPNHRRQVHAGDSRHQGRAEFQPRPLGRRRPELRGRVERGDAVVQRSERIHRRPA